MKTLLCILAFLLSPSAHAVLGGTATSTVTRTTTRTITASRTPTITKTVTGTRTPTFTRTVTATKTQTSYDPETTTFSYTATATPSVTQTLTYSYTYTKTITSTFTATLTATPTWTPTFTKTITVTATPTFTATLTVTPTPTVTPTSTGTPSGGMAFYSLDNVVTDTLGNYNAVVNTGSVPFSNSPSPCSGSQWAGDFAAAKEFDTPAGLNAAFNGLTEYSILISCVRSSDISTNPVIWRANDDSATFIQVLATGQVRVALGDITKQIGSAVGAFAINTNYSIAVASSLSGNTRRFYMKTGGGAMTVTDLVATDTDDHAMASSTGMYIGRFDALTYLIGRVAGVNFYNVARSSFP